MQGGISQTINDFLLSMGIMLPRWAGAVIIILVLLCFFPFLIKNARTQKARVIWKSSFFEPRDKRERLQQEALALVEGNPSGLFSLVELAIHNSQLQLAEDALKNIPPSKRNIKKNRKEIRRLLFRIEQKAAKARS